MDAETENVTNVTEKPEKLEDAWAKAIAKQAEEHHSKLEETATCDNNFDAHR